MEMPVWSVGWADPLEEENDNWLQYSSLENPKDRGAWWATVQRVERVRYDWATNTHSFNIDTTLSHFIHQSKSQSQFSFKGWDARVFKLLKPFILLFFTLEDNCFTIVLVSAKHQHESAISILVIFLLNLLFPPPIPSHPSRLSQSISLNSLHHTENFHCKAVSIINQNHH